MKSIMDEGRNIATEFINWEENKGYLLVAVKPLVMILTSQSN